MNAVTGLEDFEQLYYVRMIQLPCYFEFFFEVRGILKLGEGYGLQGSQFFCLPVLDCADYTIRSLTQRFLHDVMILE